jgi:hypothetical protein
MKDEKKQVKRPRAHIMGWADNKLVLDKWVKAWNGPAPRSEVTTKAKKPAKPRKRKRSDS